MSRLTLTVNENITIYHGSDHAIGGFIDIIDKRFAESGFDNQGEGFVLEYSDMFGFSNNKINIEKLEELSQDELIISKCNEFINKLQIQK